MSDIAQRQVWIRIADEMGLDLVTPDGLRVTDTSFTPICVLKDYGGPNGMVLFARDDHTSEEYDALYKAGYGYSVLELDNDTSPEDMHELLNDWGKNS